MTGSISMTGVLSCSEEGERTACIGIDLSTVDAAPGEELLGVHEHFINAMAGCLDIPNLPLGPFDPVVIVGLEVRIDRMPPGPVFFPVPAEG